MKTLKKLTPEEETILLAKIKNGTAQQLHLCSYEDMFKPRGSMQKNSLGAYLLEKLENEFESWTDSKYADNPPADKLLEVMFSNIMEESVTAWTTFVKSKEVIEALNK